MGAGHAPTFFDFDGTLADTNLVHVYAFYARHCGRLSSVAGRLANLAVLAPTFHLLDAYHRVDFARALFGLYRGMSRDRLERLSEDLYAQVIEPRLMTYTAAFLETAREHGPLVLVTGAPDFSVAPFVRRFGFEGAIATRLEFRDGMATGRMLEPVVFGSNKGRLIREYAAARGWDLEEARAYADSASDQAMLGVVGRAGVVNPTTRLARIARDYGWQILRLE
ncbi:MAG: HAD-IB family hydrolase [Candidatus Sericytochromatia bacterium]|nr:HAD-IB family hydrolase [Candidatus Tanganyikabacteria bacterium]